MKRERASDVCVPAHGSDAVSVARAAWSEWRRLRTIAFVLAALAVAWPVTCHAIAVATSAEAWDVAAWAGLAWLVLPIAALSIGASVTAGEHDASTPSVRVVAQLGVRALVVTAIAAAGLEATALALGSSIGDALIPLPEWDATSAALILGGAIACCFAFAAIGSAFASTPLHAMACGTGLAACLDLAGPPVLRWLMHWSASQPDVVAMSLWTIAIIGLLLAVRVTSKRSGPPLGARAAVALAARVAGATSIVVALIGAWALLGPVVARRHALAVLRENESIRELAWFYWSPDPRGEDNWVTQALREAAEPLGSEMGRRARIGAHPIAALPPAEGVEDMRPWLARELATPSSAVTPPPDTVVRLLGRHEAELERVRVILLSGDVPRWSINGFENSGLGFAHELLLSHALVSARDGASDVASRDLLADWRLLKSLHRFKLGRRMEMAEQVAAALRKVPMIAPEWEQRLDAVPFRDAVADNWASGAANGLRMAQHVEEYVSESGLTRWLGMPIWSWDATADAEGAIAMSQALRDPSNCGIPRRRPFPREPTDHALRIDLLTVQLELARKVIQLQQMRAMDPTAAWPHEVPGIEHSACLGLSWRYAVGDGITLTPEGAGASRLERQECQPTLAYASP